MATTNPAKQIRCLGKPVSELVLYGHGQTFAHRARLKTGRSAGLRVYFISFEERERERQGGREGGEKDEEKEAAGSLFLPLNVSPTYSFVNWHGSSSGGGAVSSSVTWSDKPLYASSDNENCRGRRDRVRTSAASERTDTPAGGVEEEATKKNAARRTSTQGGEFSTGTSKVVLSRCPLCDPLLLECGTSVCLWVSDGRCCRTLCVCPSSPSAHMACAPEIALEDHLSREPVFLTAAAGTVRRCPLFVLLSLLFFLSFFFF